MKNDKYFLFIHILLLLIVLIGFAPSFYLRSLTESDPLPPYLILHGIACTTWFVVILLQSYWAKKGRISLHRRYGRYFSWLAPIISLSGFWVVSYRIEAYLVQTTAEVSIDPGFQKFQSMLIWGDILVLLSFFVIIYLGYRYRFQAPFHKRFMLFGSIMIIPQAFVRIGKIDLLMIGSDPGISGSIYAVAGPVLLLLSLTGYDWLQFRKLHRVTKIALIWYISLLISTMIIMRSGLGVVVLDILR